MMINILNIYKSSRMAFIIFEGCLLLFCFLLCDFIIGLLKSAQVFNNPINIILVIIYHITKYILFILIIMRLNTIYLINYSNNKKS